MASRDLDPDLARRMGRDDGAPQLSPRPRPSDRFPVQAPGRRWRVILVAAAIVLAPPIATLVYYARRTPEGAQVRLIVTVAPDDAVVQLDGVQIGGPSPKVVYVRPGAHLVTVKRDGFARFDRVVDVRPGDDVDLPVALARAAEAAEAGAAASTAAGPRPHRPTGPAPHARAKPTRDAPAKRSPGTLYLDLKTGDVR